MYYSGAIMGLLIQAGYQTDPRIEKGFQWLLCTRQDDGGWVGCLNIRSQAACGKIPIPKYTKPL